MSRFADRAETGSLSTITDDAPAYAPSRPNVRPRPVSHHRAARPEEVPA